MKIYSGDFSIKTYGPNKLFNLNPYLSKYLHDRKGIIILSVKGSTGGLLRLPKDESIKKTFEKDLWDLISVYGWTHPGNAYAHLRSTLIGTWLALPLNCLDDYNIYFLENQTTINRYRKISFVVIS